MEVINVNCLVYSTQTVGSLTLFAKYTSVCTSPLWCCIAVFVMYPICLSLFDSSIRTKVSFRDGAHRVMAKGMFPNAEVVRGHDWLWGDQDGVYTILHSHIRVLTV